MPFNNARINMAVQTEFIRRHAELIDYHMAMKCSCSLLPDGAYYPDANRANPNCRVCNGLGIFWTDKRVISGMVQSVNQQKDLLEAGIAAPGDLVMSPDPRYTISDYDKITIVWREGIPYEGELVRRSLSELEDTLNYQIVDVLACMQTNPTTGEVTQYDLKKDFTFDGRKIIWNAEEKMPTMDTFYSVKYAAVVEWICFAPPQARMERGTNLGQRVIMRKKHLITFGQ